MSFIPVVPTTGPSAFPTTGAHPSPREPIIAIDGERAGSKNHGKVPKDKEPSYVSGPLIVPITAIITATNATVPVTVHTSIKVTKGLMSPCLAPPTLNSTGGTTSGHTRSSSSNGASVYRGCVSIHKVLHGPRGPATSARR